jgi:hypothetical protein
MSKHYFRVAEDSRSRDANTNRDCDGESSTERYSDRQGIPPQAVAQE